MAMQRKLFSRRLRGLRTAGDLARRFALPLRPVDAAAFAAAFTLGAVVVGTHALLTYDEEG
jgi:hypothetical protein